MRLMQRIRDSIKNDCFPVFVKKFIRNYYATESGEGTDKNDKNNLSTNAYNIPEWVVNALNAVNIKVLED